MIDAKDRTLLSGGYPLALMLIVLPLAEAAVRAWPLSPTTPNWRWGLIGYVANGLTIPMLGFVVMLLTAVSLRHRGLLRWGALAGLCAGVLMALSVLLFLYDGVRIRGVSPPETFPSFDSATSKATISLVLGAAILLWTSWESLKAARRLVHEGTSIPET